MSQRHIVRLPSGRVKLRQASHNMLYQAKCMIKQTITLPLHLQHPLRMGVRYPGGTINQ